MLYRGKQGVLATKHGKEAALRRPICTALGMHLTVPLAFDTDKLGTFSGEIERVGSAKDSAIRKARLGMAVTNLPYGFASEGSFGPHPLFPFAGIGHEIIVFVDDVLGIEVIESLVFERTNFQQTVVQPGDRLEDFLAKTGFPNHALIARPNVGKDPLPIMKGVQDIDELSTMINHLATQSEDGRVLLETDIRAHLNPTRMAAIRKLGFVLARRIRTACPNCATPGFGRVGVERGLPCKSCGSPTNQVRVQVDGCSRCGEQIAAPRTDGLQGADPGHSIHCNP